MNYHVGIEAGYDLRLSGLLHDNSTLFGKSHLGLVFVARLRQHGLIDKSNGEAAICFSGTGELNQNREQFDPWSRLLLDHLEAL